MSIAEASKNNFPPWEAPDDSKKSVLKLANSLTGGAKVKFVPVHGNVVNWYGCGPTVYDAAHMGHARNYVSFDILRRIMEDYFGYQVNMCMNITDIDDKIIARANEVGIPFHQLARFWENDFMQQMKKLNCKLPDVITRVSEYVPEIIDFIQKIIQNGFAYESQGSVYFDIQKFRSSPNHFYGRMEPWSVNDEARVLEGEGALSVQSEKKSHLDFALWKKVKAGEPSWPSPWGEGRPGWHIECSAMACDVLGFPIDIHSGGVDLRFPHHDNELAQSEACFDEPHWVKYFLHSGHLHIKGLKMSKSLKNFITIEHILKEHSPRIIRLLALIHKWDQPMNYDPDGSSMKEPLELDRMLTHFFGNMTQILRQQLKSDDTFTNPKDINFDLLDGLNSAQKWDKDDKKLMNLCNKIQNDVHDALCDNFNTPLAFVKIQEFITAINNYVRDKGDQGLAGPLLAKATKFIYGLLKIFGLTCEAEGAYNYGSSEVGVGDGSFDKLMDTVGNFRHRIRDMSRQLMGCEGEAKDIAKQMLSVCDEFRDDSMSELGIILEDKGDRGFVWKRSSKEEIMRERKRRADEEAMAKKLVEERKAKQALIAEEKARVASLDPMEYFRQVRGNDFLEYDSEGIPTKLADGTLVGKGQREKLKKILDKHKISYQKILNDKSKTVNQ